MGNDFRKLYLENPLNIFLYESFIDSNIKMTEKEIFNITENKLYVYYPLGYNYKFDLNKGFEEIYINETIYNKCYKKANLSFVYSEEKFIKAIYYVDNNLLNTAEVNNIYDLNNINKNCRFITCILNYSEENIKILQENGFNEFVIWYKLKKVSREKVHTALDFNNKLIEIDSNIINQEGYKKPTLLLHSCCGPCSSYCLELLCKYFDITILYYNPNIIPKNEFYYRLEEQKKVIDSLNLDIKVVDLGYNHEEYLNAIKGLNDESEGGERCFSCYRFRFEVSAKYALENNFDYFSTTLSISPYKNSEKINEIGIELENKYNVKFLYSNFKLNNGYKRSIELSKMYNIYRQDYCGCEFSLNFHKK